MSAKSRATKVRKRVWHAGRLLVLFVALVATFGVFFLASMRFTTTAREVEVPDLRGRSLADARAALADSGLNLQVEEGRRADKEIPADHVLSQEPGPGVVIRRQRSVRVRLSDGQRAPVVPAVANLPEHTAEVALQSEEIAIGYRAEIRSAVHDPGAIVAHDPPAGERSSTVNVVVNRGGEGRSYVVPDLIGTQGARAAEVLRGQGFRVAVAAEVPYPGLPAGIVVRQLPQAGFRIQQSDTITLEVSR
jgi:serine/threonine-protein kinase